MTVSLLSFTDWGLGQERLLVEGARSGDHVRALPGLHSVGAFLVRHDFAALHFFVDLQCQVVEGLLYVDGCPRRSLGEAAPLFGGQLLAFCLGDPPTELHQGTILSSEIAFVADEHVGHLRVAIEPRFVEPLLDRMLR